MPAKVGGSLSIIRTRKYREGRFTFERRYFAAVSGRIGRAYTEA
jgi:hypothetical protein